VSLGLLVAGGGNALANLAARVAARSAGGTHGCDTDLDSGGRFAVLVTVVPVYPAAHVVLGGLVASAEDACAMVSCAADALFVILEHAGLLGEDTDSRLEGLRP
jgi:hypothetical protein